MATLSSLKETFKANFSKLFEKQLTGLKEDPFFRDIIAPEVAWAWNQRNVGLQLFRHFYDGDLQKYYLDRFEGETQSEFARRCEKAATINEVKKTINRAAEYLYACETPVGRRCKGDMADEFMQKVWEYENVDLFMLGLAVDTSIEGFCVIENVLVDLETDLPFLEKPDRKTVREQGIIRFNPLSAMQVIPQGVNRRLTSVIIMDTEETGVISTPTEVIVPKLKAVTYVSDTEWLYWELDGEGGGHRSVPAGFEEDAFISKGLNPYGDVNIPFSIFRNHLGDFRDIIGDSDVADMIDPQKQHNETLTDERNVLRNHGNPILALYGADLPEGFKRTKDTVLSFPEKDMNMEYVVWEYEMEASEKLRREMQSKIYQSVGFSDVTFGKVDNIGQVRNLKSLYLGDIKATLHKRPYFEKGEKAFAKSIMRLWEHLTEEAFENYEIDIVWPDDFVPVDTLLKAQTSQIKIMNGEVSIRDMVKRNYPELTTDEEIDAKVLEIFTLLDKRKYIEEPGLQGQSSSDEEKELEQR